jgi:aurora kinase A
LGDTIVAIKHFTMERASIKHPYFANPLCRSGAVCGLCNVAVNTRQPNEWFSAKDFGDHETSEMHKATKTTGHRDMIVGDLISDLQTFACEFYIDQKRNKEKAIESLSKKYLLPKKKFPYCVSCCKLAREGDYGKGQHKHTFRGKRFGHHIAGCLNGRPDIVSHPVVVDDKLSIFCPMVQRELRQLATSCYDSDSRSVESSMFVPTRISEESDACSDLNSIVEVNSIFHHFTDECSENVFDFDSIKPESKKWSMEDFDVQNLLGQGGFGHVKLAQEKKTKFFLALKTISMKNRRFIEREIANQQQLRHKNVLRLYSSFQLESEAVLMLEYCKRGSLQNVLDEWGTLSLEDAKRILLQIVDALSYCHSKGLIHRDIKPENILLGDDGNVKLADFGLSICEKSDRPKLHSQDTGTIYYMAPEMIGNKPYNKTVDIWSLGNVLYELLVGRPPFYEKNKSKMLTRIKNRDVKFPSVVKADAQDLILKFLAVKPEHRITLEEVKNHSWLQGVPVTFTESP